MQCGHLIRRRAIPGAQDLARADERLDDRGGGFGEELKLHVVKGRGVCVELRRVLAESAALDRDRTVVILVILCTD